MTNAKATQKQRKTHELNETTIAMLETALSTMIQAARNVCAKPIGPELLTVLLQSATEIAIASNITDTEFAHISKVYYRTTKSESASSSN